MRNFLFASVAFSVLISGQVFAQNEKPGGPKEVEKLLDLESERSMDLKDILRESYQKNPSILAARASLKAVMKNKGIAQSGYLPKVDVNGSVTYSDQEVEGGGGTNQNFSNGGGTTTAKSAGVELDQPLFRGGTTFAELRRADELINAARADLRSVERQILFLTAQAYMDVLRDEALVKLNENNKKLVARQLKATRDRYDVGDLTRTDVSQSEFRLARADADLTTAKGNLRVSRARFEQLVGFQPEGLKLPKIDFDLPKDVELAAQIAEKNNPDVHGAMFTHNAALEQISSVRGELLPQISLRGDATKTFDPQPGFYDEAREQSIGVVASMPLYEGGAIRSRVKQAREIANQRLIEINEAERSAREESTAAFENLAAAVAEIQSREVQVESAEIAQNGVRQEAELGDRTILDALDADQEVLDAQTSFINAKRNEIVAQFALASALGLLNAENMPYLTPDTTGDKAP